MKKVTGVKHILSSLVAMSVLGSAAAWAVEDPYHGSYFGARAGYSYNDNSCGSDAIKCDKDEEAYGLFYGYDFNRYVALELSANDIGDTRATYPGNLRLRGDLFASDLSVKFSKPLSERTRLYAKFGAAYWRAELLGTPAKIKDSGYRPLAGVGFEFPLSNRLAGRFEYQYIDKVGNDEIGYADPHYVGLALVWNFSSRAARVPQPAPVVRAEPRPEPAPAPAPIPEPPKETRIVVDENRHGPLFAFDKSEIANTASIDPVVEMLKKGPELRVQVIGHTDSVGADAYNQGLSERRAQAVARYLERNGITNNRITVSGKGESEPVADNSTNEGRAQNRRVEFVITGVKVVVQ